MESLCHVIPVERGSSPTFEMEYSAYVASSGELRREHLKVIAFREQVLYDFTGFHIVGDPPEDLFPLGAKAWAAIPS